MNTTPPSPPLLQYAGFWWRSLAWSLDALVLSVLFAVLFGAGDPGVGCVVVSWLYCALMESSRWQATLGKRACGLIVIDTDTNSLSFARASGRHFAKYISMLTFGVGYAMAAFTERRQALHDLIADTLVIRMK